MTIRKNVSAGSSVSFFEEEREGLFAPPAHFHPLHPALCSAGQPLWMHLYNPRPLAPCWAQPWGRVTSRLSEVRTERWESLFPSSIPAGPQFGWDCPHHSHSSCQVVPCVVLALAVTVACLSHSQMKVGMASHCHQPLSVTIH